MIEEIIKIIYDCESIQKSNESEYTKKQEKINAYNSICELIGFAGSLSGVYVQKDQK